MKKLLIVLLLVLTSLALFACTSAGPTEEKPIQEIANEYNVEEQVYTFREFFYEIMTSQGRTTTRELQYLLDALGVTNVRIYTSEELQYKERNMFNEVEIRTVDDILNPFRDLVDAVEKNNDLKHEIYAIVAQAMREDWSVQEVTDKLNSLEPTEGKPIQEIANEYNVEEYDKEENVNISSVVFEGLYFEIPNIFVIENVMGQPVLFFPITITNLEVHPPTLNTAGQPIGNPDYRWVPEIRRITPSGLRSLFETDTLNNRKIFQLGSIDGIANYYGAIAQGYLPFVWEGYGKYRVEIRGGRGGSEVREFIFNISQ